MNLDEYLEKAAEALAADGADVFQAADDARLAVRAFLRSLAGSVPAEMVEAGAKGMVEAANVAFPAMVSWDEMADAPKEANRKEARRCLSAALSCLAEEGNDG